MAITQLTSFSARVQDCCGRFSVIAHVFFPLSLSLSNREAVAALTLLPRSAALALCRSIPRYINQGIASREARSSADRETFLLNAPSGRRNATL